MPLLVFVRDSFRKQSNRRLNKFIELVRLRHSSERSTLAGNIFKNVSPNCPNFSAAESNRTTYW